MSTNKPTIKDTKATILSAYKKLLEKHTEDGQMAMKPEETVKTARTQALLNKAPDMMSTMAEFAANIGLRVAEFSEVSEAVKEKKSELKTLFDIETEAYSLASLIDANKVLKDELQVDMSEKRAILQKELDELKLDIKSSIDEENIRSKRAKENIEYEYERTKKEKTDTLNDQLEDLKKRTYETLEEQRNILKIRESEVTVREKEMTALENEFDNMKDRIADMPLLIDEKVRVELGKQKGMLESRLNSEKNYIESAAENVVKIADEKVAAMTSELTTLKTINDTLQTKIETAYREIKDMAVKTVEGAGNTNMFNELKGLIGDKGAKH